MTTGPLANAALYNQTLDALRQTLQPQQVTAANIAQTQQAPNQVGLEAEPGGDPGSSGDPTRGTIIDILA
ncbi:MAG: hypothetical protein MI741_15460 [Rhodospirillales bacterium]|nr:hypothetical protein [Rhodospirillales bacterium]